MPLSTIFQLYHGGQFIGGGNRSTLRKPPTCRKSHNVVSEYTSPNGNFSGVNLTTITTRTTTVPRPGPQQSPEKLFRRFLRNARCEIMADTVDEDNVEEHQKVDEFKVIIFFNIH